MGSVRLPHAQLTEIVQPKKRNSLADQILAIGGNNPLAQGLNSAVPEISDALVKRAEIRRKTEEQAKQIARLGVLGGEDYSGLDPSQASSFAAANRKSRTDIQQEARKQAQKQIAIRSLETQFNYPANSLGDDYNAARLKVTLDHSNSAQNRDLKEQQFRDKQLTTYSKQLENTGIPNAIAVSERVLNLLPEKGRDIPGFGPIEKYVPNILAGDQARSMRQAAAQLFNIELKNRSGAAVVDSELQRLKDEFGQGRMATEESLRQGILQYTKRLQEIGQNIDAGFTNDVKDEYQDQGGRNITDTLKALSGRRNISESNAVLPAAKQSRLEELRRKRAAGTLK